MMNAGPAPRRRRAGRLERAVRRDIRGLGAIPDGAHALAEIALILAMAVDSEEGPLTARAKLAQELRITLAQLREVVRDSLDGDGADGGDHSPVWDAEVT